jgi:WD40 repeat protein/serine/threonine protein kinase
MIKCPNCGRKVLGEDLISGLCSHCQHRLSTSDSASGSGDIVATLATEVSQNIAFKPDSVSGGLSGFDRDSSENAESFAQPGSSSDSAIDQTMQSDEFIGESNPGDAVSVIGGSHEVQRPDTSVDSGYADAEASESAATFVSDDFGPVDSAATVDSAVLSGENNADRTFVSDDDSAVIDDDDESARTMISDSFEEGMATSDSGDDYSDRTMVSEEFVGVDDPEAAARTLISDSFQPIPAEGDADKTFVSEEIPEALLKTVESVWGDPESVEDVRPNMTLKAKEAKQVKSPKQTLIIKTKAFSELTKGAVSIDGDEPEYELLKVLGEGGMGIVYDARQTSIDRNVAVKMLKPATAGNEKQRAKFLAEAVVTGDLDHPNIVPIYDVGANSQGALFYSMKKVQGTPWLKVIHKKSIAENIDILMRICDAVGFAHARGIVHRDLKPENVMLGEFGEVLVMDWGLAQASRSFRKSRSITETNTMGGTPAYMAPEMATGPLEKITPASDVYLIGAMLFELITGGPPHVAKNAMKCLMAAARNEIAPTDKTGELVDIAMKAMATDPKDRYPDVKSFQAAIRDYQSHSESIVLSTRAEEDLTEARQTDDYQHYSRALFGFQEAYELWSNNKRAFHGICDTQLAYADSARRKGDFDLGLSLLDPENEEHAVLRRELIAAQDERVARQKRLVFLKRMAGGLAVAVFMVVCTAAALIYNSQLEAIAARDAAVEAKGKEEEAKKEAVKDRDKARAAEIAAKEAQKQEEIAKAEAVIDRDKAVAAQKEALEAKKLEEIAKAEAEREAYISKIGLAASQIDKNAFDAARGVLKTCKTDLQNWEWGRLMYLCFQSEDDFDGKVPLDTLSISRDDRWLAVGGWDATARIFDRQTKQVVQTLAHGGEYVHSVTFSPDGKYLATGSNDPAGFVQLWDCQTGQRVRVFQGHEDAVVSVAFSSDGKRLLSGSYDKTARLWNVETGTEILAYKGHTWWVWSVGFSRDDKYVVTGSQDGTAIVWDANSGKRMYPPFRGHRGPVYTATFSPDGTQVVSAGYDHRILIWNPREIEPESFKNLTHEGGSIIPTAKFVALEGHTDAVRSIAFANKSDATLLVSAGQDNTVRVWDFATRRPVKAFRGHGGSVQAAAILQDGKAVLSASHDHIVRQWSIDNYEELRTLQGRVLEGHHDAILAATYSGDQKLVVTASRDRTARTWNARTGKPEMTFEEGHAYLASAALFFPDGRQLLTAAVDNTARIWDVATGGELLRLDHTGRSAAATLSADAHWVATGSDDKTVQLWDAKTGKLIKKLPGHTGEVTALAFAPNGKLLATGDAKGHAKLWNIETGEVVQKLEGHTRKISAIVFLPDGSRVLTASLDKTVNQWDVATGKELPKLSLRHPDAVLTMKLIPGATPRVVTSSSVLKKIAAAGGATEVAESHLVVWNAETAKQELAIKPFAGDVFSLDVASDGSSLIGANSTDRTVRKWDLSTGTELEAPQRGGALGPVIDLKATGGLLWSVAYLPGSDDILTVGGSDARLWNTRTQPASERMSFSSHRAVASARFSPDGTMIVTGSWDNSAKIWNVQTGHVIRKLDGQHTSLVNTAVFSPDGKHVLTASDDGTAKIWSVETGEVIKTLEGHSDRVRWGSYSPHGKYIVTTSGDKTVRLWNGSTYEFIREFKGHEWSVLCADFTVDEERLVTGSDDKEARIWEVATGRVIHTLRGHTASVTSVSFSPDAARVLTGSQDQSAKLWETERGKEILTLSRHTEDVTSVAFSPDGRQVLTGSRDGTAVIWLSRKWAAKADMTRASE